MAGDLEPGERSPQSHHVVSAGGNRLDARRRENAGHVTLGAVAVEDLVLDGQAEPVEHLLCDETLEICGVLQEVLVQRLREVSDDLELVLNLAAHDADLSAIGLTPHKLRHTAASAAIAIGADVKVVQQMLRHKDATETLNTYGHLWPDRLDEVSDALEAARTAAIARSNVSEMYPRGTWSGNKKGPEPRVSA